MVDPTLCVFDRNRATVSGDLTMPVTESQLKDASSRFDHFKIQMESLDHMTRISTENWIKRIGKIDDGAKKLKALAEQIEDCKDYFAGCGRGLKMLEDCLAKAKSMSEADAVKNVMGKKFGSLVPYSTCHEKSPPVKPQLLKAVEAAIAAESTRFGEIAKNQNKLGEQWDALATTHIKDCEQLTQGTAAFRSQFQGPGF
jgi:hypothetical protein